jgi:phage shock protein PspC (stress-responsive transcriptional regulator)
MKDQLDIIAHVIQLAIAPVFLLTGIGALLGVMTQRIARIVDRARSVEESFPIADPDRAQAAHLELRSLSHRVRLVNRAVTLCVLAALLVCGVIGGLFITAYYAWSPDLTRVVATVFAAALLALIGGLLFFLREVYIATATLRFGVK